MRRQTGIPSLDEGLFSVRSRQNIMKPVNFLLFRSAELSFNISIVIIPRVRPTTVAYNQTNYLDLDRFAGSSETGKFSYWPKLAYFLRHLSEVFECFFSFSSLLKRLVD